MIWKGKKAGYFCQANATKKVSRFLNRSRMQVEIKEDSLVKLNQKMIHQERSVILLMDNATVHPIGLKEK